MSNEPLAIGATPTVATDPATKAVYATDNSIYQVEPRAVTTPRNSAEVAQLLADNFGRATPFLWLHGAGAREPTAKASPLA